MLMLVGGDSDSEEGKQNSEWNERKKSKTIRTNE
jgi:hypothetical protein